MIEIDLSKAIAGIERLERRMRQCEGIMNEAKPLMGSWERIVEENNRYKVLSGIDKDGNPAPPLRYRPKGPKGTKLTVAQRLGQRPNLRRGKYAGLGEFTGLLDNNNLTSSQYRKLDGPRLAPRRQFSRVITNLYPASYQDDNGHDWHCVMAWRNVVTPKGERFLHYHFDGEGNNPQYDLRGVTPSAISDLKAALRAWAKDAVRRLWRGAA